jgi:hypothetical protein
MDLMDIYETLNIHDIRDINFYDLSDYDLIKLSDSLIENLLKQNN